MRVDRMGKSFKIKKFNKIKFEARTENKNPLKSCYIIISGTIMTKEENKKGELRKLIKGTSQSMYNNLNKEIFNERFIQTDLIPDSFKHTGKCFASLEYTFFIKKDVTFQQVQEQLNILSQKVYDEIYDKEGTMTFYNGYLTKKNENTNYKSI